jgi:hypothetical protein
VKTTLLGRYLKVYILISSMPVGTEFGEAIMSGGGGYLVPGTQAGRGLRNKIYRVWLRLAAFAR